MDDSESGEEANLTGVPTAHAQAAKALATFGTTVVTETGNLARYVGRILGTAPEDAVGLVLGDPLHYVRAAIAGALDRKIQSKLERRRLTETRPVSPSVAIPLIRAAYDEGREELQELWASLIVAAMDPARVQQVRLSFIETLRNFDPLDAFVLQKRHAASQARLFPSVAAFIAGQHGLSEDEVMLSAENLKRLNCVWLSNPHTTPQDFHVTRYGVALLRAVSD